MNHMCYSFIRLIDGSKIHSRPANLEIQLEDTKSWQLPVGIRFAKSSLFRTV